MVPSVKLPSDRPAPATKTPSLMGRVTMNGIVGAAVKVFARKGVAGTRVEDILEEAAVARRTFYRYFSSKEEVLSAVYEFATNDLLARLDDMLLRYDDAVRAIHDAVDLYLDFHVINASTVSVLAMEAVRPDSPLSAHRREVHRKLGDLLARAASTRHLPALEPFTCVALVSGIEGVALALLEAGSTKEEVERARQSVHGVIDRVIAPRGGRTGMAAAPPNPVR